MATNEHTRAELIEQLTKLGYTGLSKLRKAELEELLAKEQRAAKRKRAAARTPKAAAARRKQTTAKKAARAPAGAKRAGEPKQHTQVSIAEPPLPKPAARKKTEATMKALATKYLTAGRAFMEPFEDEDIPERYGVDRLTLMAVNPRRLFVFWEITPGKFESVRQDVSDADWERRRLVIRLYPRDAQAHVTEIEVHGDVGRWHIRTSRFGEEVVAKLGFVLPGRKFVVLASSNAVFVPRLRPAAARSVAWMRVMRRWIAGRPSLETEMLPPGTVPRWWSRLSAYEVAVEAAYFSERLVR